MKFKIQFQRFILVYFILYTLPFPLDYLPFGLGEMLRDLITNLWKLLVPFVADELLCLEGDAVHRINGSGDSLFFYLMLPTGALMSSFICLMWFGLSLKWKRLNYDVFRFFLVYIRYYLAFALFIYGFAKVFYLQFHQLSLFQLTQEFGDASPMGLLWKFMGYSEPYSIFTGCVEVFAGGLLIFRKTKIFGACLSFGIMLQVFMLNMSYDVSVKLYSFHLVLILIIVLSPHLARLCNFFFTAKQVKPYQIKPYFKKKRSNRLLQCLKYSLVVFVLVTIITDDLAKQEKFGKRAKENILYGVYEVDMFILNNVTIEVSRRNPKIWDRLIIDKSSALVEKMDRGRVGMQMSLDSVNSKLIFKAYLDENDKYDFNFKLMGNDLVLIGTTNDVPIKIELSRKKREDYFLEKRGYNWINEYPMNR